MASPSKVELTTVLYADFTNAGLKKAQAQCLEGFWFLASKSFCFSFFSSNVELILGWNFNFGQIANVFFYIYFLFNQPVNNEPNV